MSEDCANDSSATKIATSEARGWATSETGGEMQGEQCLRREVMKFNLWKISHVKDKCVGGSWVSSYAEEGVGGIDSRSVQLTCPERQVCDAMSCGEWRQLGFDVVGREQGVD
jgi:hypothetical protein